ncbi:hypothetical protein [Stenotrophomonas sp. AB1(2024)]|uniref:hypothetical protein n=1 Tax=Stenotrophomonas sp. AB1(2024) TaxID=3132215 RepID=UPI0030B378F7
MAEPSKARNFFGRVVDRILPGSNYDSSTGTYSNIGKGALGLGARLAATAFAGPAVGALVGRGAGYLIDHTGNKVSGVQPENVNPYGPVNAGYANGVGMPATPNLGLGAQTPGNTWAGYLQGQGSTNNLGNTQFGNGMAGIPGSWGAQSQWGQQITAQPAAQGSNLGFGSNVQSFAGGGGGGGGGGGSSMGGSGMGGIVGGRLANESMLDVRRRW